MPVTRAALPLQDLPDSGSVPSLRRSPLADRIAACGMDRAAEAGDPLDRIPRSKRAGISARRIASVSVRSVSPHGGTRSMPVRYQARICGAPNRARAAAPASAPSLALASSCSGAEQLGLGGGEFGVGQDALLIQGSELVQLVNHRRGLGRGGRCGLVRRRLLLLELADPLVLLVLRLTPLLRPPAHAPSRDIRAAAHHGRTQQRSSSPEHLVPPWSFTARI